MSDFLASLPTDGEDPFVEQTEEMTTPPAPLADKESEEDEPSQEGENTPGEVTDPKSAESHKVPVGRLREVARRNRELLRQNEELLAFKEEQERKATQAAAPAASTDQAVPAWFGGDKAAWDAYQAHQASERQRVKEELVREQEAPRLAVQRATEEANDFIDDQYAALEESGRIKTPEQRQELAKFMLENPVMDQDGNYDLAKGLTLMEKINGNSNAARMGARKSFANSLSPSHSGGDGSGEKDYMTAADFAGKDVTDLF